MNSIYFIRAASGHIKIGTAINVRKRLAGLQSAHAEPLILIGTITGDYRLERRIHRHLAAHRALGEWFRPHADVSAAINLVITGGELPPLPDTTVIEEIFCALGGQTEIANQLGVGLTTVDGWKNARNGKPNIPDWRRGALLSLIRRSSVKISPEAIAYLASSERKVEAA